jgi:hypothetical protein
MTGNQPDGAVPGLLAADAADGRELLAAATTDWARPVPHWPEWTAADLLRHMGGILAWMTRIGTTGESVSRGIARLARAGHDGLPAWYSGHLERTIAILTASSPDAPAWTFSSRGDRRAGWWRRRRFWLWRPDR